MFTDINIKSLTFSKSKKNKRPMLPAPCMGFISDSFHGSHRKTTEHFTMHMHWVLFAPCALSCVWDTGSSDWNLFTIMKG